MHLDPGNWNERIGRFAEWVACNDDLDAAAQYLVAHYERGGSPLRGLQVVLGLMRCCNARQCRKVSHLLDEFMSDQLPRPALRFAREQERRMYLRLGLRPRPRLGF